MNPLLNRRLFLKKTSVVTVGVGLTSQIVRTARAADLGGSANDKLRVAVIGTNGRGLAHIECLTGLSGVEIAYICDVDERAIAKGVKAFAKGLKTAGKEQKTEPKTAKDFRKV